MGINKFSFFDQNPLAFQARGEGLLLNVNINHFPGGRNSRISSLLHPGKRGNSTAHDDIAPMKGTEVYINFLDVGGMHGGAPARGEKEEMWTDGQFLINTKETAAARHGNAGKKGGDESALGGGGGGGGDLNRPISPHNLLLPPRATDKSGEGNARLAAQI